MKTTRWCPIVYQVGFITFISNIYIYIIIRTLYRVYAWYIHIMSGMYKPTYNKWGPHLHISTSRCSVGNSIINQAQDHHLYGLYAPSPNARFMLLGLPHYDDFWMYASTEHLTQLFMWSHKCRTVVDAQERKGPFLFGSPVISHSYHGHSSLIFPIKMAIFIDVP